MTEKLNHLLKYQETSEPEEPTIEVPRKKLEWWAEVCRHKHTDHRGIGRQMAQLLGRGNEDD